MIFLIAFFSIVSGVNLAYNFSIFILLLYLGLILISIYFLKKKTLVFLLVFFISYAFIFIVKSFSNSKDILSLFLVIKSEENYILVSNIVSIYYLKAYQNNYEIGDIIYIAGQIKELGFSHFQEGFDFKTYLNSFSCFYQIDEDILQLKFSNFIKIKAFEEFLLEGYSSSSKQMISSLLFKESMKDFSSSLYVSNISYLVSVSGIHIYFLTSLISKLLEGKIKDFYIDILIVSLEFIILILSMFSISIFRIFLMNLVNLIFKKKGIYLDYIKRFSLVGIICLLFRPLYVINIGFMYSFIIPLIFYFARSLLSKRSKYKKVKTSLLFFSLVFPLNMYANYGFNLLSFLFSLVLAPIFSFLFVIDFFIVFKDISRPFLEIVNSGFYNILTYLIELNVFIVSEKISQYFLFVYYLIYLTIIYLKNLNFDKLYKKLVILSIFLNLVCFLPDIRNYYEVHFIDVGQGDSTLIRYKRYNILIDTGGSNYNDLAKECLIPYFNKLKISKLDLVLITHDDFDHIGSLDMLKQNFPIDRIELNGLNQPIYFTDFKIEDLNKYKDSNKDSNYNSSVFSFSIRSTSFLIMGDASKQVEELLIEDSPKLNVDVIKLGHHGSSTSSSYNFLESINPKLAIISCGYNNIYNHPSKQTLDSLNKLNIPYFRTDLQGSLVYKC